MMDQLINAVSEKTGLPVEQARAAAEAAVGFLQDKLPEPAAGLLKTALGAGGGIADQAAGMLGNLGGMFGGGDKTE